jgi:glycosyl transferase family 1
LFGYSEIVASGIFLFSAEPENVIPYKCECRKYAAFCWPDLSDLPELIRYYAFRGSEGQPLRVGHNRLLKYHTCERRAAQFLEICQNSLQRAL